MKSKESAHVLLGEGRGKNLDMFLLRKGNFVMINGFRYGQTWKFGHLHLVYHFTVPLNDIRDISKNKIITFQGTSFANLPGKCRYVVFKVDILFLFNAKMVT